jgi:hypothetical protein
MTHPCQVSGSNDGGVWCPIHNSRFHSAEECRQIKKLVDSFTSNRSSSHTKTACLPASGRANKRWIERRARMKRWSSKMPSGR